MPIDFSRPAGILVGLLPEIWLTCWAIAVLLIAAWHHGEERDQRRAGYVAFLGLLSTAGIVVAFWSAGATAGGSPGMMTADPFRFAMDLVVLLGALLAVALSWNYLDRERIRVPEFYALILLATVGMMFMAGGTDLIVLFLGLELMSVCAYVLAGIDRRSAYAAEAALKYFLLGAFASGFLLYGIALLYGAGGTTNLFYLRQEIASGRLAGSVLLVLGIGLLAIGFAFKVAAVPFHMWAPDVYDGAPTPVTAYMAAAVKAAAFAGFVRVLFGGLEGLEGTWTQLVSLLAVLTMLVGNLIALVQRRLKRLLAYSSVGHAGYLLAALAAGTDLGAAALVLYVLVYTLMTVGAFAVVAAAGRNGERDLAVDDLSGLARRRPGLAFAMAVFMLALLGFPGTAGFIGKWYILAAVVDAGRVPLAVILVIASVISAGYYLPVIMAMYMKAPASDSAHQSTRIVGAARVVVAGTTLALLLFGVWPNAMLELAERGTQQLRIPVTLALPD